MKKIVLLVMLGLIIGVFNSYAQNKSFSIKLDGKKIHFPLPTNSFTRINENQIDSFAYLHGNPDSLIALFIDTDDYNKIYNKNIYNAKDSIITFDPSSVNLNDDDDDRIEYLENFKKYKNIYEFNKFITITYDFENMDNPYTADKFINEKNNCDDFLTKDINQTIEKSITFMNDTLGENEDLVFQEENPIGFIYDIDNAYGILSFDMYPFVIFTDAYVSVHSILRIKDMRISIDISSIYKNSMDIYWIKDFSETWAKAILEANK